LRINSSVLKETRSQIFDNSLSTSIKAFSPKKASLGASNHKVRKALNKYRTKKSQMLHALDEDVLRQRSNSRRIAEGIESEEKRNDLNSILGLEHQDSQAHESG